MNCNIIRLILDNFHINKLDKLFDSPFNKNLFLQYLNICKQRLLDDRKYLQQLYNLRIKYLCSLSEDLTLHLFNLRSEEYSNTTNNKSITAILTLNSGPYIAIGLYSGDIKIYSLIVMAFESTIHKLDPSHFQPVNYFKEIEVINNKPKAYLLSSSRLYSYITVWDLTTYELVVVLSLDLSMPIIEIKHNNHIYISINEWYCASIWDTQTWEKTKVINGVINHCKTYIDDKEYLVGYKATDRSVVVYCLQSADIDIILPAYDEYDKKLCLISVDGVKGLLASGGSDGYVRIWDIGNRKLIHNMTGHDNSVYFLELLNNKCFIVSGDGEGIIKLWSGYTGRCIRTIYSNKFSIILRLNTYKDLVACVCNNSEIVIWDVRTGENIYKIKKSKTEITRLWEMEYDNRYICEKLKKGNESCILF